MSEHSTPTPKGRPFIMHDVAHRPAAPPRRAPFPAVESLVAPVRPSLTKDGFSTDDSTRNTIRASFGASFPGTRSCDRGTRDEWIRLLALYRLAAKASAGRTELRRCRCLAPVLESHARR